MTKTLEVYCPFCGRNMTLKTISEIMAHYQKEHNLTLIEAVYSAIQDTFENQIVEVDT
jgi:uncharacterized Zn finger protein (UPF0148 family)